MLKNITPLSEVIYTTWFRAVQNAHQRVLLNEWKLENVWYMNPMIRYWYLYQMHEVLPEGVKFRRNPVFMKFAQDLEGILPTDGSYRFSIGDVSVVSAFDFSCDYTRNIPRQIGVPFAGSIYCRISNYGNFYWLRSYPEEGEDLQKLAHLVSDLHSLLRDQHSLMEISIDDPLLDHPLEVFGEEHGSQIYTDVYKKTMHNIELTLTFDDVIGSYVYSFNPKIRALSFEEKCKMAEEDFISIQAEKVTPHPILVNRQNEIVESQFNVRDLLFGEFW